MRRVLFIQHDIRAPHMGAIRCRRIAKRLPSVGWEPVLLACAPSSADASDPDIDAPVLEARAIDLAAAYNRIRAYRFRGARRESSAQMAFDRDVRLTTWLNKWFFIPDKQLPWIRDAVRVGRHWIKQQRPDLIFASLDPRSNLIVAAKLAREFSIPCVMEYRDLWTGSPYTHLTCPTRLHRALHVRLERHCLKEATRLVCLSRGIANYFEHICGEGLVAPPAVVHNFFDPEEFSHIIRAPRSPVPFILTYAGAMYWSRNPKIFFEGLRRFLDHRGLTPMQFQFNWLGETFSVPEIQALIAKYNLGAYIRRSGRLPHAEALRQLMNSHAALVIQASNDQIHLPGKLFEAMGARVPLLVLSSGGEVMDIVARTRAGVAVDHDAAQVADALNALYDQSHAWAYNEKERETFSARAMIKQLGEIFDEAVPS